jgi:hypothetical protein
MSRGIYYIIGSFLFLYLTACVTPMGPGEIDDLTSCKGIGLPAIRKNLLLAGYDIQSQGEEDLTTGFKQVSGYGTSRGLQRITVVKIAENQFRFRVTLRSDSMQAISTGSTTQKITTTTSGNSPKSTYENTNDQRQLVSTSNEGDQTYYVEHRGNYESTRHAVCGN